MSEYVEVLYDGFTFSGKVYAAGDRIPEKKITDELRRACTEPWTINGEPVERCRLVVEEDEAVVAEDVDTDSSGLQFK